MIIVLLAWTGKRVEVDRIAAESGQAALALAGLADDSHMLDVADRIGRSMIPIQLSVVTPVDRIQNFDPERLPLFSHLETRETVSERIDPQSLKPVRTAERRVVLVERYGYLRQLLIKALETLEIAVWATLIAAVLSLPMALLAAKPTMDHGAVRWLVRGMLSILRAIPELIGALLMVLVFGFGPAAGVLALALHGTGFLGKFYAEDMENAPSGPQEALRAIGANRLLLFRYAILPQVLPQFVAYTVYLLDRNFRMATMIGLVGAGGIGQELKGRYDMYEYHHVATIILIIVVSVLLLELLSARLRRRLL
ncbi:MAG: phosphonate ABC transporter, permease protein PhnE [Sphingopyxis sp.]|uniref:phosphonate ABC transporter, permease protein PhnE n=1 Tax=Sphingopyxis sp. TaxID=1908224 RepID=UPI002AB84C85|nr:phosphonate ABC transporter, permease protein PhnE [Sphingopyxis sp.]MDZ3832202.1 phosphonate ABC transporter, permease protein PhnE [Sphingopyxis sp.]